MDRGLGVYCQELALIDTEGTAFEGEGKAIKVTLLILNIHNFNWALILIDSKAIIPAVTSNTTPKVLSIIKCR